MKSRKNSGIESPDDARMTERVTLVLPSSLVRSIDEIAKKTERNRSAQIRFFLRDAVIRRNTEDAEAPIPGGRAFENRRGAGGATAGAVK
jgi:predicted transcriptional regulator